MPATSNADPFAPDGVAWVSISPKLITARLITTAIVAVPCLVGAVVAGVIVGGWMWLAPAFLVALLAWIAWLIPRQVRAFGYAQREDDFLVRKGVMFRSLVVVPYGRMQFTDVESGPLARSLGIATVQLHTASAGSDATVPGLKTAVAAELKDRLTRLGESRLAGL